MKYNLLLVVVVVLLAIIYHTAICIAAPTKPSYSKEYQADITETEILHAGNVTLSNGKEWFSRSRQSIRIQGYQSGQLLTNIDVFPQHTRFIIVGSSYCGTNRLDGNYGDPFDLLQMAKYVTDVTVNGKKCHQWSYTQGNFLDVSFYTSVTSPFDPVRLVFLQNGEGAQIDFTSFQNNIANYSVFTPPSICPHSVTGPDNSQFGKLLNTAAGHSD